MIEQSEKTPFTHTEERSILSLAFDEPDFFAYVIEKLKVDYFSLDECKFIFEVIRIHYTKNATVPSRELTRSIASKHLTVDDPNYEEILSLCDYKINPRDYEFIKKNFVNWLREKAYGQLFSDEAIEAFKSKEFDKLTTIVEDASRVTDISGDCLWFFNSTSDLFVENKEVKYTTGFPALDALINDGGPTKGDVLLWMAGTGVGKSIIICNNAAACIKRGLNVLHVTCELSSYKTACRYCGIFSNIEIDKRFAQKGRITEILSKLYKSYKADLVIAEYPPDDISVNTIMALVDHLKKTRGWIPQVIAIDYLELLMSKNEYFNREEYIRQKKVATEVRQLAKKTGTFVISATQTNREPIDKQNDKNSVVELSRVSESYGKTMPTDYVISINQTRSEYKEFTEDVNKNVKTTKPGRLRLYIAKNRNGPKFKSVDATVNYATMIASETEGDQNAGVKSEPTGSAAAAK